MRALRLVPPLAWTAVIFWLSTDSWSAAETSGLLLPWLHRLLPWATPDQMELVHWLVRKGAHVTEYGVLGALWSIGLGRAESLAAWRRWLAPLGLSILTAALDELHQATTLARTASPADVLLDSSAAGAVLIWRNGGIPALARWLTGALLWVAAAGGTALVALDWSVGVRAHWLWWSTPVAWVALGLWRRRHRPR